jgi:hypothetical protein
MEKLAIKTPFHKLLLFASNQEQVINTKDLDPEHCFLGTFHRMGNSV